jgi:hypothetical protein
MKGAAELAELQPKGRQTRDNCIAGKGESKGFELSEERSRARGAEARTEKLNVFARLGSSR